MARPGTGRSTSPAAEPVASAAAPPATVVLAGVHGHGRQHLENIRRLTHAGAVRLVGLCDPRPPTGGQLDGLGDVRVGSRLDHLLRAVAPDITVICTPIHTHAPLARAAMRAGSHVLLEKPPAATMADYLRLVDDSEQLGRACQIGFQDLASRALPAIRELVAGGAIGALRGVGAACAWSRDAGYFNRADWAGRRELDGVPVVDGALTNPFAHAVAAALAVADAQGPDSLASLELELYRANPIESDDTSCLRMRTSRGLVITVAATLCADVVGDPHLVIHGARGRITLAYKTGEVRLETAAGTRRDVHGRTDLLQNLAAHAADPAVPLVTPLTAAHSFMEVLETVRLAADPAPIPRGCQRVRRHDGRSHVVVDGSHDAVVRSAEQLALFSELPAPWTREVA